VDGVQPTFDSIADGKYPVSRPLFFYVKKAHVDVIPGMKEYLDRIHQRKSLGPGRLPQRKGHDPHAGRRAQAVPHQATRNYLQWTHQPTLRN
jgi:hypothetical protein